MNEIKNISPEFKSRPRFLQLLFVDINGSLKGMEVPIERYEEAVADGIPFDGSSIPGFQGVEDSDLTFMADPSTLTEVPWEGVARVYGYIYKNGKPYGPDPRGVLMSALKKLEKEGFKAYVGPEPEFYLFKKNGTWELKLPDIGGYFDVAGLDSASLIKREIASYMPSLGLVPEVLHHEVGKAQHEINFRYDEALRTADNIVSFKHVVRAVASFHGLHATFMPKPIYGLPGNGMHLHISLWQDGKNAFVGDDGLSETALHFIAGILEHARALTAVTNPTVNSYKRLLPGYEAPVYIGWGYRNRSALIRVPAFRGSGARVEYRCPDPSANPYYALAAVLMAGLDGVKRKLEPPEPMEGNLYEMDDVERERFGVKSLPENLGEALSELKKDRVVAKALGTAFKNFISYKEEEWNSYTTYLEAQGLSPETKEVTEWELERYFYL